jgi:hypothetical protein
MAASKGYAQVIERVKCVLAQHEFVCKSICEKSFGDKSYCAFKPIPGPSL